MRRRTKPALTAVSQWLTADTKTLIMTLPPKFLGFLLAIAGNTLIACSLTLQKSAHNAIHAASASAAAAVTDTDDDDDYSLLRAEAGGRSEHARLMSSDVPGTDTADSEKRELDSSTSPARILHHHRNRPHIEPLLPTVASSSALSSSTSSTRVRGTFPAPQIANADPNFAELENVDTANRTFATLPPKHSHENGTTDVKDKEPIRIAGDTQKKGKHVTPDPRDNGLAFLRSSTWWMGTALMAAGEIGNFAAFAFAPASLVAPLGAWSVVLAAVLAHTFLGEPATRKNVIGIVLCVSGALLIGTTGPDVSATEAQLDEDMMLTLLTRPPFVAFIILTLLATATLIALGHYTRLGEKYIFVYIGVNSLLGAVTVVCAKALSTFLKLTFEGNSQFGHLMPIALGVALAVAIVAQLRYLNLAMERFGNSQVVPIHYVLFTSCAMTSGVIMYREFEALQVGNFPFFIGIAATMSGVFLVRGGSAEADKAQNSQTNRASVKTRAGIENRPVSKPWQSGRPRTAWSKV